MDERVRRALAAVGSFDEKAARRLEESAREIRGTWRGPVSAGEATGEKRLRCEADRMRGEDDFNEAKRGPVVTVGPGKTRVAVRLDEEVVAWFKAQVHAAGGGDYQGRINAALREFIDRRRAASGKARQRSCALPRRSRPSPSTQRARPPCWRPSRRATGATWFRRRSSSASSGETARRSALRHEARSSSRPGSR